MVLTSRNNSSAEEESLIKLLLITVYGQVRHACRHLWAQCKPYFDLSGDEAQTVIVAGSARSGTTWVGDVIASLMGSRPIFEPFLFDGSEDFALPKQRFLSEAGLRRNHQLYIRPEEGSTSRHYVPIQSILRGRVRGAWCDSQTRIGVYRRRLIKEIRVNLFLAYLAKTWPALRIIWLIRNPFDVIDSQIAQTRTRKGWTFDWDVRDVLSQQKLLTDWLAPFVPSMKRASSLPERLAHKWCVETYVPLRQEVHAHPGVLLVRYEELKSRPEENWKRIARFLSAETWQGPAFELAIRRPSRTSRKPGHVPPGPTNQHAYLSQWDKETIREVLHEYGLSNLYPENDGVTPAPDPDYDSSLPGGGTFSGVPWSDKHPAGQKRE